MKLRIAMFMLLVLVLITGCGEKKTGKAGSTSDSRPVVYATNYPIAYFAQRIAGDLAEVRFPEIDGDPAFWQPTDEQVTGMQAGTLILMNGATYEKWVNNVSLPPAKTVDTSAGFADRYIKITEAGTHSHGKDGEHSHAGTAFTTWMDFEQARQQAEAVRDALIKAMPNDTKTLQANADALLADLAQLHKDMQKVTSDIGDRPLMASHPVYQYYARQYGLNIKSVLWEPETVPSADDIAQLKQITVDHPANWMIWEGEPAEESVKLLRSIGFNNVVVDPASNRPGNGDWLSVMRQNIKNLARVAANDG